MWSGIQSISEGAWAEAHHPRISARSPSLRQKVSWQSSLIQEIWVPQSKNTTLFAIQQNTVGKLETPGIQTPILAWENTFFYAPRLSIHIHYKYWYICIHFLLSLYISESAYWDGQKLPFSSSIRCYGKSWICLLNYLNIHLYTHNKQYYMYMVYVCVLCCA